MKWIVFAAFALTVPAANWLIGNVGTLCIPHGPCLIPIGFGLMAPSGVLMIGLALVLRDWLHELGGWKLAAAAILAGAALSVAVSPALAMASAAAFMLAETADLLVYTPLRRRGRHWAVLGSGVVGAAVDSVLFLWLAFGALDGAAGLVLAKLYASAAVAAWLAWRAPALTAGQ